MSVYDVGRRVLSVLAICFLMCGSVSADELPGNASAVESPTDRFHTMLDPTGRYVEEMVTKEEAHARLEAGTAIPAKLDVAAGSDDAGGGAGHGYDNVGNGSAENESTITANADISQNISDVSQGAQNGGGSNGTPDRVNKEPAYNYKTVSNGKYSETRLIGPDGQPVLPYPGTGPGNGSDNKTNGDKPKGGGGVEGDKSTPDPKIDIGTTLVSWKNSSGSSWTNGTITKNNGFPPETKPTKEDKEGDSKETTAAGDGGIGGNSDSSLKGTFTIGNKIVTVYGDSEQELSDHAANIGTIAGIPGNSDREMLKSEVMVKGVKKTSYKFQYDGKEVTVTRREDGGHDREDEIPIEYLWAIRAVDNPDEFGDITNWHVQQSSPPFQTSHRFYYGITHFGYYIVRSQYHYGIQGYVEETVEDDEGNTYTVWDECCYKEYIDDVNTWEVEDPLIAVDGRPLDVCVGDGCEIIAAENPNVISDKEHQPAVKMTSHTELVY